MSWFIIIFPIIPLLFWREHRPFSDAPANQVGYIPHYIPMISPLHSHDFPMIFSWYPTLSSCLPMISILYPYEPMHGRFSQLSPMIFQRSPQYTLDIHITLHPYDMPLMVSFIPISHQISRGYPHWIPIWYPFLMINSQRWKTQKKKTTIYPISFFWLIEFDDFPGTVDYVLCIAFTLKIPSISPLVICCQIWYSFIVHHEVYPLYHWYSTIVDFIYICPQNIPWHIPIISPLCFEQQIPSSLYNYPHIPMQIVASSYPPVI